MRQSWGSSSTKGFDEGVVGAESHRQQGKQQVEDVMLQRGEACGGCNGEVKGGGRGRERRRDEGGREK